MATIKPFSCVRPAPKLAGRVAALPYDVYSREEAKAEVMREPLSFLKIDRAETAFDDAVDAYAPEVYAKAKELLQKDIGDGVYIREEAECYYIYELVMDGRPQTGIVACASIEDYENQVIKKHENTREDKEIDRITHVDTCGAQTGPIFLAYRSEQTINDVVERVKAGKTLYDFTAPDGVIHRVWCISGTDEIETIRTAFSKIGQIYIADGHHRAASAVKVGLKRRAANPSHTGTEEYNYFLSVLFPHDQLMIMDYNRVVKDLNGLDEAEFLKQTEEAFKVEKMGTEPYRPERKGMFGMYLGDCWYRLTFREPRETDPVAALDVAVLQEYLLGPVLGIEDPKTDRRIDFVGGIRGLGELERRVHTDCKAAFSIYPTSIQELFAVSDAGMLMPPKSTWFEPKLRSGLFIHRI